MVPELRIGIDIGGQSTKCGVVDTKGNIIAQCVFTSLQQRLEEFLRDLTQAIDTLMVKSAPFGTVIGIGVGAPNANYYKGTIEYAPNLKWAVNNEGHPMVIDFVNQLSHLTSLPVTITNDANAAAMGEKRYGVAVNLNDFIMITLGTGVGSGIMIDGNLVYGHDGFAGELGHVCAVPDGRQCACGLRGCLETYTSAIGVARTARQMLSESSEPSLLREIAPELISSKSVFDAAEKGDRIALEVFDFTGRILGASLANFIKFSAPEAIILFGGLTKSKKYFHGAMVSSMNNNLMHIWKDKISILYSSLKESDAAILGASALV